MAEAFTFIGFGEAGAAFARPGARAFDRKTGTADTRAAKLADYAAAGVTGAESAVEAQPAPAEGEAAEAPAAPAENPPQGDAGG